MSFKIFYCFLFLAGTSLAASTHCRLTAGNTILTSPNAIEEVTKPFLLEGAKIEPFDSNRIRKIRLNIGLHKFRTAVVEVIDCPANGMAVNYEERLFGKGLFTYHSETCSDETRKECFAVFVVMGKSDVCTPTNQPLDLVGDANSQISIINLRESFEKSSKPLGKGAYGETVLYEEKDAEDELHLAIKRVSVLNFHVNEVFYARKFSSSPFGSKYRGCQYEKEWVYVATDSYKSDLSKLPLTTALKRKKSQRWRVGFYRKLIRMLIDLRNLEIVHCDIKAGNIMIDESLNPHLIDYDAATRAGGLDSDRSSQLYRSPKRVSGAIADSSFDLYSMAWVIYVIEHQRGEEGIIVIRKNPENKKREFVPDHCWDSPRPNFCVELFKQMTYETFSQEWGLNQFDSVTAEHSLAGLLTKLISEEWTGTLEEIDAILEQIEEKASDKTSLEMLI